MTRCFFVSDLHGKQERFRKLFEEVSKEPPRAVFIGGDMLPHVSRLGTPDDFLEGFFLGQLAALKEALGERFPRFFVILGNDDGAWGEEILEQATSEGMLFYAHGKKERLDRWVVYGYSYVPPTPFLKKDWEKYDVSRHVDPGCVPPTEGWRSKKVSHDEIEFSTIKQDLEELAAADDLSNAVFLFHAPPHGTVLDRAPLDGIKVDHIPMDVHVGSIAIRRFIERRAPLLTMHGHVHESPRLTGSWIDKLGHTVIISAAHDGPELALVKFDLEDPASAVRELL